MGFPSAVERWMTGTPSNPSDPPPVKPPPKMYWIGDRWRSGAVKVVGKESTHDIDREEGTGRDARRSLHVDREALHARQYLQHLVPNIPRLSIG